jgi:membrane-bound ClpP family serine protease
MRRRAVYAGTVMASGLLILGFYGASGASGWTAITLIVIGVACILLSIPTLIPGESHGR